MQTYAIVCVRARVTCSHFSHNAIKSVFMQICIIIIIIATTSSTSKT